MGDMRFPSPLRYPGGKGKLANFVKLVFCHNNLFDAEYVEPYAGGTGIALALLFDEYVSHIHINDLNHSLYAFWYVVLNETEALCNRIRDTAVTMEEWYRQRAIQEQAAEVSLLDLGFSTFFLNRTNRSGILKGGVIGGKNQAGVYQLDARYNVDDLVWRIQRIARYRNRISIYNQDAADFIANVLPNLSDDTLIYLDPPYYVKGQDLYENYYDHNDHVEIATLVSQISQNWIVTYDNVPEIHALYSGYSNLTYDLSYSAAERYRGAEVMFFSPGIDIPDVSSPALVKRSTVNQYQVPLVIDRSILGHA